MSPPTESRNANPTDAVSPPRKRWKEKLEEDRAVWQHEHFRALSFLWFLFTVITLVPARNEMPRITWVLVPLHVVGFLIAVLWSRYKAPAAYIFTVSFLFISCIGFSFLTGATGDLGTQIGLLLFAGAVVVVLAWLNRRRRKRRRPFRRDRQRREAEQS